MQQQVTRRIIRRSSAVAKPATNETPKQTAQTEVRQIARRVNTRVDRLAEAELEIAECLKAIKDCDENIDRAQEAKSAATAKIEALMREHKLSLREAVGYEAELAEKFTRQQITVDPKKYRTKVGNEEFWSSIEVSVTKAREHLGEKELLGISDVKRAESRGTHLEVREAKKKRK